MKVIGKVGQVMKRLWVWFSVIFTVTTIGSSLLQLVVMQREMDSNWHILNRAALVMIALIILMLFSKIHIKNRWLSYLVPYSLAMALVFGYVWLTSLWESLHPNAYRDVFLNFTVVALVIGILIELKRRLHPNKREQDFGESQDIAEKAPEEEGE